MPPFLLLNNADTEQSSLLRLNPAYIVSYARTAGDKTKINLVNGTYFEVNEDPNVVDKMLGQIGYALMSAKTSDEEAASAIEEAARARAWTQT